MFYSPLYDGQNNSWGSELWILLSLLWDEVWILPALLRSNTACGWRHQWVGRSGGSAALCPAVLMCPMEAQHNVPMDPVGLQFLRAEHRDTALASSQHCPNARAGSTRLGCVVWVGPGPRTSIFTHGAELRSIL